MEKSSIKKSSIIEKVKELEAKGQTFVTFDGVCLFLHLCNVLGVLTFGGAFADDMSGQWFYK